ncbi:MAG: ABC transporter ATP-binding protein [Rhodobacteraceae bacterium]|nr:ABC transporter ATP-binding protein [Paracoccaceae bacterium]
MLAPAKPFALCAARCATLRHPPLATGPAAFPVDTSQDPQDPATPPRTPEDVQGDFRSGRLFARLWRGYLHRHVGGMALAFGLMVIEGSTLGALSWMLEPLFDRVFVGGDGGLVLWVGLGIFGLFLVRAGTSIANRTILTSISLKSSTAMQADLLEHMLALDGQFFQDNAPGALIERVQGDTLAVQNVWQVIITGAGRDLVTLISLFAVAISVAPNWTMFAVIGVPLLIAPTVVAQRYVRRKTRQMRAQSGDRATRLDEIFHGIVAVKLNRMEGYQLSRFRQIVNRIVTAQVKTATIKATIPAMIDVITGLGFFLVLMVGGREIIAGERTVGEFMSFFTAMALAFQPLRRLGAISGTWQTAAASLERLYRLFDLPPRIVSPARPLPRRNPASTEIVMRDVQFAYGGQPVLRGLNLTARAGEVTALVGPSGAGKSTVFGLLTRLIEPQSGQITLGGTAIEQMELGALRDLFSVVTQDAPLFDETLRENILLGHTVDEARLEAVLHAAHVADFLPALPQGLDSPAGPRGSNLSGGQRQRVAIARALLRNAPILLLDEATSALDTKSEQAVQAALEHLSAGRTTLVIAHRLATVRNAHKILVMDKGRVVEEGTHDALLAQGGLYAGLYRLQFASDS